MNETMTTVVGNVITDVTQRRIGDGTRVASFRMASNERRFDKETQQWVNGDSLYVTVTCWRKLALGVNASLVKGDPVIVTGRLFTRGYEVEGQKRSVTELEAVAVGPDLSRCMADVSRARRQASEDAPVETPVEEQVTGGVDGEIAAEAAGEAGGDHTQEVREGSAPVAGPGEIPSQQSDQRRKSKAGPVAEDPGARLAVVGAG